MIDLREQGVLTAGAPLGVTLGLQSLVMAATVVCRSSFFGHNDRLFDCRFLREDPPCQWALHRKSITTVCWVQAGLWRCHHLRKVQESRPLCATHSFAADMREVVNSVSALWSE